MVIFVWILVIICAGLAIGLTVLFAKDSKYYSHLQTAVKITLTWLILGAFSALCLWVLYATESGKRAQKTLHSETTGGLERTVKVYDFEGDLLEEYTGKFDVAENMETGVVKVKFDCDGKRHIIYCSTGTVIIDER